MAVIFNSSFIFNSPYKYVGMKFYHMLFRDVDFRLFTFENCEFKWCEFNNCITTFNNCNNMKISYCTLHNCRSLGVL
jgi:uncharacterized protein YjbI with pentapeptide repeats